MLFKTPKLSFERLRREHVSDEIFGEIKTLEDLGVKLTSVEDRFPFEFKYYRNQYHMDPANFRPDDVDPPPALKY